MSLFTSLLLGAITLFVATSFYFRFGIAALFKYLDHIAKSNPTIQITGREINIIYSRSVVVTRLSRPPGWNLRRFAELCFSKKTFTKVLEPTLSDMQKEHFEALAAGRRWKARIVLMRGYWSFWSAVAAQLPISFTRRVYEVWKATKTGS